MNRLTSPRAIGLLLAFLGIVGLSVSLPAMARRLSNRGLPVVWFAEPIGEETFKFAGEPVEVRTVEPPDGSARPRVQIDYRGRSESFEIEEGTREDPRLPGLLRHDDWLRVLLLAEGASSEADLDAGIARGDIRPRLVIAMRLPAEGFEPGSWGAVRRKEWRYRFVELLPASTSPDQAMRTIETTYAEIDALGDPSLQRDSERRGDVWQYYAMQHVTPPTLVRSRNRPIDDAMQAMGWTWPAAGFGVVGLVAGLVLWSVRGASRAE